MTLKRLPGHAFEKLEVFMTCNCLEVAFGEAVLVAMPGLNHDQHEFLVSGMTPWERRERFGPLAL